MPRTPQARQSIQGCGCRSPGRLQDQPSRGSPLGPRPSHHRRGLQALGILLGLSFFLGEDGTISATAAFGASVLSAPFINPIRMIEKQQRAYFKQTGAEKPIMDILRESAKMNFQPLFRGTVPLMGHSCASALLGLAGQPKLQKHITGELSHRGVGNFTPIYSPRLTPSLVWKSSCRHPRLVASPSVSWMPARRW